MMNESNPVEVVEQVKPVTSPAVDSAWAVATGKSVGKDEGVEIKGAENDYNSRGNGSTMARRVLRNGSWQWVSAPASRGRYLASDRKDVQKGDVYEGEIVATYTLGSKNPKPDYFALVAIGCSDGKVLRTLDFVKIKSGYRLTRPTTGETIDVSDPSWR